MYILADIFLAVKSTAHTRTEEDSFSFLKWHPTQAGLLMFNINLRMQEAGMIFVNAMGSVIYLAYLYNGIQQEGAIPLKWPDMDRIIDSHAEEHIFMGGKPKTVNDSVKKMCLMMGMSVNTFLVSSGRARSKVPKTLLSKKRPWVLEETTTVSRLFRNRYCNNGSVDLSISNIETLLNDIADNSNEKAIQKVRPNAILKSKWHRTQSLTPLQLLIALRERLVDEEPLLTFNYFGLHQRCKEVLQILREAVHDKFVQYFGPEYLQADHQLPFIVHYIFTVAKNSAAASQQLGLPTIRSDDVRTSSVMMARAGTIMQDFLKTKGGVGCKELRVFCKNKKWLTPEKENSEKEERVVSWMGIDQFIDPAILTSMSTGIRIA